jgi:hypothetical protein
MRNSIHQIEVRLCTAQNVLRVLALVFLMIIIQIPVFSQTYTGRILGTVYDRTGAVMPSATVVVTDVQRGISRTLAVSETGEYVAAELLPGAYKVVAQAKGFKTIERPSIVVEVATDVRVDFTLQPGDATERVIVTEEVPLLNTTSSTLGGTLDNKEINDLPLNGRNYENLLQLRPGVVRYPGGGFSTTSTNGLRAEDNAYLIDGLFNSEPFSGQSIINGAGIAGDSATILPIDAIQEFNLQENPPAEYGWKPGAIVNVGLKSGTNEFHGTGYAFGRDTPLDARNFFNTVGSPETPRQLEQFGGSIGGPIVKDKIFFFGAYEGQRYTLGNSYGATVPTFASLGGDPANSIPDAIAAVHAAFLAGTGEGDVSPVSLAVAGCTLGPPVTCNGKGFPTNNNTGPNATSIQSGFPNTVSADNAVGKIDYHINDRNTLSGRYFFGNNSGTVADAGQLQPQWLTDIHTRAQVFGVNWTWIPSAHWANEARFGYNRLFQPTFSADHTQSAESLGIPTGVTNPLFGGLPRIKLPGFSGPFPFETLGGFKWPKIQGPDERYQFVDHISHTIGKHALKFGGEIHHDSFTGGAFGAGKGLFVFAGGQDFPGSTELEDFFAGAPASVSALVGNTAEPHVHNWSYASFVEDDWRVTKNLTLNLGLRYDYNGVISESHNLLGNFDPNLGLVQVGQQISSPYNGDHTNFAPRFGFAWDPFGTGRTVVRGGGGIIYEQLNWESFLAFNNTLGLITDPTGGIGVTPGGGTMTAGQVTFTPSPAQYNAGPIFPQGAAVNCSPTIVENGVPGSPCAVFGVKRNLSTPYVTNWNLNVQHAFTNTLSLEVAYVGDHGANLVDIRDINQPVNGVLPFGEKFPFLSNIFQLSNLYESNYNGLQATLTARNYHHFTFVAGYTYSHALDDVGANWDFGAGLGIPQDSTHPHQEYANSDFDMRHRFTLSMVYDVPGRKSFAQLLEGWQLISIVSLYGSQPWGVIDSSDNFSGSGEGTDRWDFFGKPSDFTSGPTSIPFFPGTSNPACLAQAQSVDGGVVGGPTSQSLAATGCYAKGVSVMIPPAAGTFGTMGRNTFRDSGFRNWDFSVAKNWKLTERFKAQFRAEFFNVLNHPNFANPFGGQNGFGLNDPSFLGPPFGCGCATPDVAASNPILGSGGSRSIQLGLKLLF